MLRQHKRRPINYCKAMKYLVPTLLLTAALGISVAKAQVARQENEENTPVVTTKGPHHRIWQHRERKLLPKGRIIEEVKGYIEIANGLHYQKDGQWVETQELFELFENGAIARQGPYQVVLSPNLNSPTAVDLLSPDGQRFQSTILGLGLFDSATGNSELIAEAKSSVGELHAPNQIVYPDAFSGFKADVRY